MKHRNRIGRLGVLAVGLGIGAAVAATGTASADDFQISIDGFDLFPTAGNTATAVSGMGDIAIAFGANSDAVAEGGFGDFAYADSTGSLGAGAIAGDELAGATGNNFDFASATGNDSGAFAGNPLGGAPDNIGSSFDFASAINGNSAVASSIADAGFNGSGDSASAAGQNVFSVAGDSANAADPANFDSASALANLNAVTASVIEAFAGGAGTGLGGNGDSAFVVDPFGTFGSQAFAGLGNSFDLAGALTDHVGATATSANFLVDILPSLF